MKKKGRIFLLDDEELIVSMLSKTLEKDGFEVRSETGTGNIIEKMKSFTPDIVLLDINLRDRNGLEILRDLRDEGVNAQVVMLTADDTAETAVKAMKEGAVDYLTKPFNREELKIVLQNILEKASLREEVDYLRKAYSEVYDREIIGESAGMKELKKKVEKITRAGVSSILITGESGTGKEVVARSIHKLMHADRTAFAPLISINCAAMPETLLESELFGYMKGSFTDAKSDKKGLFELAKNGSILLDEIGEMQPSIQSKLLRVLEERVVRRIGGKEEKPIEVTVIATTNRNLSEAVGKGSFRSDLFFRLSAFNLHLAPLRERVEDIAPLTQHFLSTFAVKYNKNDIKGVLPETEKIMLSYTWPGNVRELRNVVESIVVLEHTEFIEPQHLPDRIREGSSGSSRSSAKEDGRFILPESGISIDELERDLMIQALKRTNFNRTSAAKLLSLSYDTFRYQMKKLGIK